VERHGCGRGVRYLLSSSLYAAIDQRGTYTRERGLDHETNNEPLHEHVHENETEGSPLRNLCEVLPALGQVQVQALLQGLKDEG
jgi:ATP-dependent DNA helicase RecG